MTVVSLVALHTVLGTPEPIAACTVTITYWADREPFVNVDGDEVTFPSPIVVLVEDGAPTGAVDLKPTESHCCVQWAFKYGSQSFTRYTSIPSSGPVAFGDLPVVDPATFATASPTATQLETIKALLLSGYTLQRVTQAEFDAIPLPRPGDVLYVVVD